MLVTVKKSITINMFFILFYISVLFLGDFATKPIKNDCGSVSKQDPSASHQPIYYEGVQTTAGERRIISL